MQTVEEGAPGGHIAHYPVYYIHRLPVLGGPDRVTKSCFITKPKIGKRNKLYLSID